MSDTTVNRLLFDGHCWKKYRERHVHEEILAFARENGLDAHRDGEHRTFVDFGVSAQSEYLDLPRPLDKNPRSDKNIGTNRGCPADGTKIAS